MKIAGIAFGMFLCSFLLHLLVWRIRLPKRQGRALALILLGSLPVELVLAASLPGLRELLEFWACAQVVLFHMASSIAYMCFYTGMPMRSPRMTMAAYVASRGQAGATVEELRAILGTAPPVDSRLEAAIRENWLTEADGQYRLTASGRFWARLFWIGQELARLEKRG